MAAKTTKNTKSRWPNTTWQTADGRVRLFRGNCFDVIAGFPGGSVQTMVTSPPYNQRIDSWKPSGMHKESRWIAKISSGYFDSLPEPIYQRQQSVILDEMFRCVRKDGSCFFNHKLRWRNGRVLHPLDIVRSSRWHLRQEIVWARNGSCTLNAKMFGPTDERVFWLVKGFPHRWNQDCVGFGTVWRLNSVATEDHACAFPVELPRRCIVATTAKGGLVCDPFMGSGTTAIACIAEGRRFVGIEQDAQSFRTAVNRIEAALDQKIQGKTPRKAKN